MVDLCAIIADGPGMVWQLPREHPGRPRSLEELVVANFLPERHEEDTTKARALHGLIEVWKKA